MADHQAQSGQTASHKPAHASDIVGGLVQGATDSAKNVMDDVVERGQAYAAQASSAANEMAETATQQIKTFASELEAMTRRNPIGTVAAAVVVGVLIGLLARGRSAA